MLHKILFILSVFYLFFAFEILDTFTFSPLTVIKCEYCKLIVIMSSTSTLIYSRGSQTKTFAALLCLIKITLSGL